MSPAGTQPQSMRNRLLAAGEPARRAVDPSIGVVELGVQGGESGGQRWGAFARQATCGGGAELIAAEPMPR